MHIEPTSIPTRAEPGFVMAAVVSRQEEGDQRDGGPDALLGMKVPGEEIDDAIHALGILVQSPVVGEQSPRRARCVQGEGRAMIPVGFDAVRDR